MPEELQPVMEKPARKCVQDRPVVNELKEILSKIKGRFKRENLAGFSIEIPKPHFLKFLSFFGGNCRMTITFDDEFLEQNVMLKAIKYDPWSESFLVYTTKPHAEAFNKQLNDFCKKLQEKGAI